MKDSNNSQALSTVQCSFLVKFIAEDDHIYHFDESWNVTVDIFNFTRVGNDKLKVQFAFQAQIQEVGDDGKKITILQDEDMKELQPIREKLEILLDSMTLHTGIPLAVIDGSFVFSGGGYRTSSESVINTSTLHDLTGLEKRYGNLLKNNDLANSVRFYRLALIDKEYSGKGIKFWASLEALYRNEKEKVETIWNTLSREDQSKLKEVIQSLTIEENLKEKLLGAVKYQKVLTDKEVLSERIKLMNSSGDIPTTEISKLIRWWSSPRNIAAHGQRVKRDDEERQDAVDDLEHTIETLLRSGVIPSMHAYFIGHPNDIDSTFWDENDHIISKVSNECWVQPTHWGTYLLENIGHHKKYDNGPLIYVSHDKIIEITKENRVELHDISHLSDDYRKTIEKIKKKLNQEGTDTE